LRLITQAVRSSGKDKGGSELFDVPLPWRGQRLVKIVQVENDIAFGRGETAEIYQMAITTCLHFGRGRGGKVRCDHAGGITLKSQVRLQHATIFDWHEFRHPIRIRCS
jgi:hypothetical protein